MSYAVSFKDAHYPGDVILHAIFLYLRYGVSYRDLEEIMAERGARVNHATLNRWVERYAGQVAEDARRRKQPADRSWRMDETYIKVKGQRVYLYRAVDKFGKTLDFMLSRRRSKEAPEQAGSYQVLRPGNGGQRPPAQDRHRQECCQHPRSQRRQSDAEALRLLNPDRNGAGKIFQQSG
jgi:hypothetical protein